MVGRSRTRAELEAYADRVVARMEEVAPGFTDSILHRQVIGPHEMETEYGLVGGNIFHGELSAAQLFHARPAAGYADLRTPMRGLYQAGSATHGGGGVTGIPGRNVVRQVLPTGGASRLRSAADRRSSMTASSAPPLTRPRRSTPALQPFGSQHDAPRGGLHVARPSSRGSGATSSPASWVCLGRRTRDLRADGVTQKAVTVGDVPVLLVLGRTATSCGVRQHLPPPRPRAAARGREASTARPSCARTTRGATAWTAR